MKRYEFFITFSIILSLIVPATGLCNAPGDFSAASEANNAFAVDLFKSIMTTHQGKNIFLSPYSISTALTMTYAGARGNTAAEMAAVLHHSGQGRETHKAFQTLGAEIEKSAQTGCQLHVANALWGQVNYRFKKDFLNLIKKYYSGGFHTVDFKKETEKARKEINDWVMAKTAQRIKELIARGDIIRLTRLVLTNAIYFKGDWASRFEKGLTRTMPFYMAPVKETSVQMMVRKGEFLYGRPSENLQILEIPYKGDDLSMVILLPRTGTKVSEDFMVPEKLDDWLCRLKKRKAEVFLPKFKFSSRYYLQEILKALGMRDAFIEDYADFSSMTEGKKLYVHKVIHQADIDVNEQGTEAAAATAVVMVTKCMVMEEPVTFKADHPFIFLIRHRPTNTILFIGRVADPT